MLEVLLTDAVDWLPGKRIAYTGVWERGRGAAADNCCKNNVLGYTTIEQLMLTIINTWTRQIQKLYWK